MPWTQAKLGTHLIQNLAKKRAHLREVMRLHAVTAHLRAYLAKSDLASFWFSVLYRPCGRAFPFVVRHMYELTLNFTFQSCHLQKDWPIAQDTVCVGPRCQCAGQKTQSRVASISLKGSCARMGGIKWIFAFGLAFDLVQNYFEHVICFFGMPLPHLLCKSRDLASPPMVVLYIRLLLSMSKHEI